MKTRKEICSIERFLTIVRSVFIVGVFTFLFTSSADAQITYGDINPDITINTDEGFYDLDMNLDGIYDFKIWLSLNPNPRIKITTLNDNNSFAYYVVDGCFMAKRFELNDSIIINPPMGNYSNTGYLALTGVSFCMHSGAFIGQTDKYIGMKLIKNGITYYGWLRVDVAADATWFTVKDFAYSPTAFRAGQIISNMDENYEGNNEIKVFENESEIIVKPIANQKIIAGQITNLLSQANQISVDNDEIRIVKSKYRTGLYFLTLQTTSGKYSIKLLIK
jgi:hypothetical protein